MFASRVTDKVTLKDEGEDVIVTIRKIAWGGLREAADKRQNEAFVLTAKIGADLAKAIADHEKKTEAEAEKEAASKTLTPEETAKKEREKMYAAYDRETILRKGVVSWTSKVKLPEGLDDLDEDSADTLHRKILDLCIPAPEVAARTKGESD